MLKHNLQLVLISGLGADERLLAPQREAFPDAIIPPWLPPRKSDGLPEYAARLAETLPRDKPFIIGGVSLGGMIACELARFLSQNRLPFSSDALTIPPNARGWQSPGAKLHAASQGPAELARGLSQFSGHRPGAAAERWSAMVGENGTVPLVKAVVLIASTPTRSGLRPFYRTAGRLWPLLPPSVFRLAKFLAPYVRQFISRAPPTEQRMLLDMFRDQDNRFMHWAVSAILRWRPAPLGTVPIFPQEKWDCPPGSANQASNPPPRTVPIFASKMGLSPSTSQFLGQIPLYHIHGDHDRVIPVRPLSPTTIIPHAGHLINLTHARQVNAFLQEIITRSLDS